MDPLLLWGSRLSCPSSWGRWCTSACTATVETVESQHLRALLMIFYKYGLVSQTAAVQLHGLYRFAQTTKMHSTGLSSVSREAKRIQTQICFLLVWYTPVDSYIQWTCDTGSQDCGCFLWSAGCFNPHQAVWLRHGCSSALFIFFFWCGSQFSDVLMMFLCIHSMWSHRFAHHKWNSFTFIQKG